MGRRGARPRWRMHCAETGGGSTTARDIFTQIQNAKNTNTKTKIHKYTNTQIHKYTNALRGGGALPQQETSSLKYKMHKIHKYKMHKIQKFKYTIQNTNI